MSSLPELRKKAFYNGIKPPTDKTMKHYGLTEFAWLRIMETQDWKCPICLETEGKVWNIDHFHISGWKWMDGEERSRFVRGILCANCNYRNAPSRMKSGHAKNLASYLVKYERRLQIGSNLGQLCECHGVPMQKSGTRWRCAIHRAEWNAKRRGANRDKVKAAIKSEMESRGGCQFPGCEWQGKLEWHHRDPSQKKYNVGESGVKSITSIQAEMAKCDLLCPNHHSLADKEME